MKEDNLDIIGFRQMLDYSNPVERIVLILAVFQGLSSRQIAELGTRITLVLSAVT